MAEAGWIGSPRAHAVLRVLLGAQILLLGFFVAGSHGAFGDVGPGSTAYISFYAAGRLAALGTPELAYDAAAHFAMEKALTSDGIDYKFFFYPPVYLLLCRVLAWPPYLVSFVVFQVVCLGGFLLVLRRVLVGMVARAPTGWIVAALAFPPLYWAVGWGQNALLTAAIFTAGILLVDRRPFLAGLVLGLLCYKPHFGLLLPVALLAGRRWAAVAGAGVSVVGLCALSLAWFGVATWQAYLMAFLGSGEVYESGRINLSFYVTLFGAARHLGLPVGLAYGVQMAAAVAATMAVAWVWWRDASLAVRGAVLLSATLLAVPLALLYDLMLLLPAFAWVNGLMRQGRALAWERPVLMGVFLLPFAIVSLGMGPGVPVGPLAVLGAFGLALRRAWVEVGWREPEPASITAR